MPNTMTLISAVTVGSGGAASIEFTSIPSSFTDLHILASVRGSNNIATTGLNLRYNSSTSNYTYRRIDGSGTTADSSSGATPSIAVLQGANATANTFGNYSIYIPNYTANINKSAVGQAANENNGTNEYITLSNTLWSDTSAITSIQLVPSSGTILQHSTAYLYGIKKD